VPGTARILKGEMSLPYKLKLIKSQIQPDGGEGYSGIGPILSSTQCRYKIPLTYPDKITVGAKIDTIEKDRFIMKYAVFSHQHNKLAALGEGVLVTFDYQNNKKALIPDEIRKRIIEVVNKD